jgi:phage replication-related protein YjqB (UPF0714/DUF867 family)/DNA-directed RNA polymerase subunit RPC12/RpoP
MKLESAKCTTCGANLKIEIDAHTAECKFCHNQIIVKNAFDFAKVELDRSKDIKNYRNNLTKAVKNSNFEEILRISSLIKDIIPNDFSANYYFAFSKQKLGYPKFMYDFFEEEYPSTEDESKQIFEHVISNSDLRDYSRVKKYLSVRSEVALQNFETEYVLRTRVEDNYANIPRDVFICFSSANIETANKISKTLEADGYATWISTKNLRPNNKDNYWSDIEKAIINNSIVLVISSAEAMVSKDVQHELELAKKHNKKLIELKIDSSAHTTFFKYIFNGIKWIDGKTINNKVIQDLKDRIFEEIQEIKKSRPNSINIPKIKSLLNIKSISLIFVLLFLASFTFYQSNIFGLRGLFEASSISTNALNSQNSSLSAPSNIVSTPNSSSSISSSNIVSPIVELRAKIKEVFSKVSFDFENNRTNVINVFPFVHTQNDQYQGTIITNITQLTVQEIWTPSSQFFIRPNESHVKHFVVIETEANEFTQGSSQYNRLKQKFPTALDYNDNGFYFIKEDDNYLLHIKSIGVDPLLITDYLKTQSGTRYEVELIGFDEYNNLSLIDFRNDLKKIYTAAPFNADNGRPKIENILPFPYLPDNQYQWSIMENIFKVTYENGWSVTQSFNQNSADKHFVYLETDSNKLTKGSFQYNSLKARFPNSLEYDDDGFYLIKYRDNYLLHIKSLNVDPKEITDYLRYETGTKYKVMVITEGIS